MDFKVAVCLLDRYPVNGLMNYVEWKKGKNGKKEEFFTDGMDVLFLVGFLHLYHLCHQAEGVKCYIQYACELWDLQAI